MEATLQGPGFWLHLHYAVWGREREGDPGGEPPPGKDLQHRVVSGP